MKTEHKYAQVLRWIADGTPFQVDTFSGWVDAEIGSSGILSVIADGSAVSPERFRIKPRTVMCNGVEVPAPESVAPASGARYYMVEVDSEEYFNELGWDGTTVENTWLARGLIYLDKDACIARAKAMLLTQPC